MWSILYEAFGGVFQIGPFRTEAEAMQAAAKAQIRDRGDDLELRIEGEFDVKDQRVYLLGPDHRMTELNTDDILGRANR